MPKSLIFEASSIAHGIGIRSILRCLDLLWSWGSLWKGRGWILWLGSRIRTPLVKGLVPGIRLWILRFKRLPCFLFVMPQIKRVSLFAFSLIIPQL